MIEKRRNKCSTNKGRHSYEEEKIGIISKELYIVERREEKEREGRRGI